MYRSLAALCAALTLMSQAGCKGDSTTPEYWESSIQQSRRAEDRIRMVEALRTSGKMNESFLPMLHEKLSSEKKPEVKAALARALGDLKHPSSVEPLKAALDPAAADMSSQLANKAMVTTLGAIGDVRAVPALVPLLRARDNYTRIEAVQVLGAMKAKEAVEPLIALATDDNVEPFLNKKAIEALGNIGDPRAAPALVRMLTKERKGKSFYVESSFALFQLGSPAADALLPALEGKDEELLKWAKSNGVNPASYTMKAATVLGDLREKRAVGALLKQLSFTHSDAQIQALVRMQAADALARMRATEAVKPLAGLVMETDFTVREAYVRALARLGGRDALPGLEKAAATGDWYSRELAVKGLVMLGDGREVPLLQKLATAEPAKTAADCKASGEEGCEDAAKLGKQRADTIAKHAKLLTVAQECASNAGCWVQKMDKADPLLLERAALEVGRTGTAEHAGALAAKTGERNTEARMAVILGLGWLMDGSQDTAKKVREASLPALRKQLQDEQGMTQFASVNEDLRRLVMRIDRT
ncbi:HEAT repeat domain-containing protein [Pyxidicoccus fallax]|uniref:HEAT repeat domain-containing protein n=1 Tax=Pyxidicoccus fallax TaxID=394095 RepID=A0A848LPU9_9BACT|nr:HEAT repeat domain-containing protein [Pyxidicoccus fallax]NMO19918.1 HEAT repeat domain-containing protein [Pyxidicoccus fallax]NPC82011.1 HEAT repeat domain-containing protein [Pyxidicoccus fallax]